MANSAELFRKNLLHLIEKNSYSKAEVADRAGIKRPGFYNYLSGKNTPGLEVLDRISAVMGVSTAKLLVEDLSALEPKPSPVASQLAMMLSEAEKKIEGIRERAEHYLPKTSAAYLLGDLSFSDRILAEAPDGHSMYLHLVEKINPNLLEVLARASDVDQIAILKYAEAALKKRKSSDDQGSSTA